MLLRSANHGSRVVVRAFARIHKGACRVKMETSQMPFLAGQKFSNGLRISLRQSNLVRATTDRIGLLAKLVAGKNIIHVGCVDHLPLLEDKRRQGLWLHEVLSQSASRCVGLDINQEGCEYMRKLGYKDILHFDMINDELPAEIKKQKFACLVLGEIIEHVDNPVAFLTALRDKFIDVAETIILTTPNAFRFQNMVYTILRRECINSDHRYWFTPYTLGKVLALSGYDELEVNMVWDFPCRMSLNSALKAIIGVTMPAAKDCLFFTARLKRAH
jgi:hypothetical protein